MAKPWEAELAIVAPKYRSEVSGDLSDLIDKRRGQVSPEELATVFRSWRGKTRIDTVATMLGVSAHTLRHIEKGRGFRYPRLLLTAMRDLKPHGRWR